jgi:ADP-heptose:LPS heptosyltransferase
MLHPSGMSAWQTAGVPAVLMKNTMLERLSYRAIAFVTETFPVQGAHCVDRLIFLLAGNRLLPAFLSQSNVRRLKRARAIRRVCILCDMNIGDAVMTQGIASAIRQFLPHSQIDYVTKESAACLIQGNPEIDQVYGIYRGSPLPDARDVAAINSMMADSSYDLVFTFCPFLSRKSVHFPRHAVVIGWGGLAAEVIRAQRNPDRISHMTLRMYRFAYDLLSPVMRPAPGAAFGGVRVTLSEASAERAERFLADSGSPGLPARILFNPDTSSDFTRIPFDLQLRILEGLCDLPAEILLGEGHAISGIGIALRTALPESKRARVRLVPGSLPIDAYAALIDASDIFITGDTGPLHIAAARKFSRNGTRVFRNRTAVLSIYAAQPGRLYGYDSNRRGYLDSSQDRSAHVYETRSCCRNMATVNKAMIACAEPSHFFQALDIPRILSDAERIVRSVATVSLRTSARSGQPPSYTQNTAAGIHSE